MSRSTRPAPRRQPDVELTERERQFVECFMSSGNATKSARTVGYSKKTASQIGYRLLRKVQIQRAIAERTTNDPAVAQRQDRQAFWSSVMWGVGRFTTAALKDRLRASELLGRSHGDFIEKHDLTSGGQPMVFQVVTNVPQAEGHDAE